MLRKYYCGRDQVVWSASVDDLAHWRCDGIIFRLDKDRDGNLINANGDGDVLYAPDVCETTDSTGRKVYYLYPNVQSDERGSAVAKSYRPDGPFEVCNWSKDNPQPASMTTAGRMPTGALPVLGPQSWTLPL